MEGSKLQVIAAHFTQRNDFSHYEKLWDYQADLGRELDETLKTVGMMVS